MYLVKENKDLSNLLYGCLTIDKLIKLLFKERSTFNPQKTIAQRLKRSIKYYEVFREQAHQDSTQ